MTESWTFAEDRGEEEVLTLEEVEDLARRVRSRMVELGREYVRATMATDAEMSYRVAATVLGGEEGVYLEVGRILMWTKDPSIDRVCAELQRRARANWAGLQFPVHASRNRCLTDSGGEE